MTDRQEPFSSCLRREIIRSLLEHVQGSAMIEAADIYPYDCRRDPDAVCEVEEILNNPYMNRSEVPLAMDIFRPILPEEQEYPVIVTIHGGGLVVGDRTMSRHFAAALASRGYLVFSIEYRLAPRANMAEQLDDVCAGLDFVGRKLVDFNVDFTRIFLTAESAGAFLAIYTAAMKKSKKLQEAIGYEPSRMTFKAVGLISGMFYTRKNDLIGYLLSEQFYGEKRMDPEFLKLMDPEHPEIIENLPPTFLITSRGDFLNNYTLMYHKVLKKAGIRTRMVYYGEKDLIHSFAAMDPAHEKSRDAIRRMTAWFEEQAAETNAGGTPGRAEQRAQDRISGRIESGAVIEQKSWKFIKELNSVSEKRLDQAAFRDTHRSCTYRQMFRMWERFAEVFSALGITEQNGSRAGMVGVSAPEPAFAFYGLNMTGTSVSMIHLQDTMNWDRWCSLIEQQQITDLIFSDVYARPDFIKCIVKNKERLGIRHIIILKSYYDGALAVPARNLYAIRNYQELRRIKGILFMEDLLKEYEAFPIVYGSDGSDDAAVIVHTSGTTKGIHKPIPLSDRGLNDAAIRIMKTDLVKGLGDHFNVLMTLDLSAAYGIADMLHLSLACGGTVITMPFGAANPAMDGRVISYHRVNVMFGTPFTFLMWMGNPAKPDLSSLKMMILGGAYVSPDRKKKYNAFLKECGSDCGIISGYGLSETAGACIIAEPRREDDAMGSPLPGVEVRIFDEEEKKYYKLSDGPRTGVLFLSSPSVSSGKIGDNVFFELEEIDGGKFINTYDLVKVNEDGSLTYIGRMNKYFVNNEGIRFDAGLVETAVSAEPDIEYCGLAPGYDKLIHDTIPVLYVQTPYTGRQAERRVQQALFNVFVRDNRIAETNMPGQCVITGNIPFTDTGKVDVYQIISENVAGKRYMVAPVRVNGRLTDVRLVPAVHFLFGKWSGIPEELDEGSRKE